jgi:hydrogenase maturation factor
MYEKVYKTMDKAGIKKEVKEAIQHENVLSSKYILTYPGYLLFIDEKGTPISLMAAKWEGSSTSCQKMLVMLQYQQEPQQTFTLPC